MDSFLEDVKFNCDVSDAKYWGYFSICGLLMRFRDLYRSEKGMEPWAHINQEEIFEWISRKEERWRELEAMDFRDIRIEGIRYHHLDVSGINRALRDNGLVYGSGYGLYMKPCFFVADISSRSEAYGHNIYVVEKEYARDIFSSSGMVQGRTIFLRLLPLRTLLWEKFLESQTRSRPCLAAVFARHGLLAGQEIDEDFERNFSRVTTKCADIIIHHELAEAMEEVPAWPSILCAIEDRKAEYFLRTVKDLLSDTSDYGPLRKLVDGRDSDSLCLYLSFLSPYHNKLYPETKQMFDKCADEVNWDAVEETRKRGYQKFYALREKIISSYGNSGDKDEGLSRIQAIRLLAEG